MVKDKILLMKAFIDDITAKRLPRNGVRDELTLNKGIINNEHPS